MFDKFMNFLTKFGFFMDKAAICFIFSLQLSVPIALFGLFVYSIYSLMLKG